MIGILTGLGLQIKDSPSDSNQLDVSRLQLPMSAIVDRLYVIVGLPKSVWYGIFNPKLFLVGWERRLGRLRRIETMLQAGKAKGGHHRGL